MFGTIVNPETGRRVNVNGPTGQRVLSKYARQLGGARGRPKGSKNRSPARGCGSKKKAACKLPACVYIKGKRCRNTPRSPTRGKGQRARPLARKGKTTKL